jgi:hypothetical protein
MDRIGSDCSLDRGIGKSVYIYYKKDTKFGLKVNDICVVIHARCIQCEEGQFC